MHESSDRSLHALSWDAPWFEGWDEFVASGIAELERRLAVEAELDAIDRRHGRQ